MTAQYPCLDRRKNKKSSIELSTLLSTVLIVLNISTPYSHKVRMCVCIILATYINEFCKHHSSVGLCIGEAETESLYIN
jgi:hypothetical protein